MEVLQEANSVITKGLVIPALKETQTGNSRQGCLVTSISLKETEGQSLKEGVAKEYRYLTLIIKLPQTLHSKIAMGLRERNSKSVLPRGKEQRMLHPAFYKSYLEAQMLHWISEDCSVSNTHFCQVLAKHRVHEVQTPQGWGPDSAVKDAPTALLGEDWKIKGLEQPAEEALPHLLLSIPEHQQLAVEQSSKSNIPNIRESPWKWKNCPPKTRIQPEIERKQRSDSDSVKNLNVCMSVGWKRKLGNIRSKNEDSFILHSDPPRRLNEDASPWVPSNTSLSIDLSMESTWARVCLVGELGVHKAS